MNFDLSEEQTMIQDSVARFVQENYDQEKRNATLALDHGFSSENWHRFAELGWLSIPFDESLGGIGGGPVDTMVIMKEFGRGLVAEPFLPTVLLFGGLIQAAAENSLRKSIIRQIVEGRLQGAFAFHERQSRFEIADIKTAARLEGGNWFLNGEKSVVLNGGAAEKLVVLARTSGAQSDRTGLSLFLVDVSEGGISRTSYRLTDGRDAANIRFQNTKALTIMGAAGSGFDLMAPVVEKAILAISADALGAMEAVNSMTLEHLKSRKQFGQNLGAFQALQHRAVDMYAAIENTKSLLLRAVCAADAASIDAHRNLLALKVMVGRAGRKVGSESIQMHGGMGMTEELAVGLYVKRLMIANSLFGDADFHQQRFAELTNRRINPNRNSEAI